MRKAGAAAAAAVLAAGLTGGVATSAGAVPPDNYGHCVSIGAIDPSDGGLGPENSNAHMPSGAANAAIKSKGNSRFSGAEACEPAP
jgi:hypothetical protein